MATVPLSGTNIRILSDVPFSNDYKHSRWFVTPTEQTNYFLNKRTRYTDTSANFQRVEGRHFIRVQRDIDSLWGANYLMFQNSAYNNKWFYAFVTKLEYVNKSLTNVHFEIDVLQTWRFEMLFKPSFVVREHQKRWNSDGTPVINTIDEGLDYGTEYDNIWSYQWTPNGGYKFMVIISKQMIHKGSQAEVNPTVIATPQPLSYYIVPFRDSGNTPTVQLNGKTYGISKPADVLVDLYKSERAVNNIVSIFITEHIGVDVQYVEGDTIARDSLVFPSTFRGKSVTTDNTNYMVYVESLENFNISTQRVNADKYQGFTKPKESKLLMYPYAFTILDDFRGNRYVYKNEYINAKHLEIIAKGSLGTSSKIAYSIKDYNALTDVNRKELSHEFSVINNNPADVPVITDHLASYMQGNRNSIQNQQNSIIFNGIVGSFGSALGAVGSAMGGGLVGTLAGASATTQGIGNSVLQLQAIEAKKQDIGNVPPNISKMGSNTAFDFGNNYEGIYVIKKQIKPEYRKKLEDFFNMYGYKSNETKVPNFHTRRYWNYVQTVSCVITGDFNNEDLQELKNVFDNGITLWHTDDIGNYRLNNEEI